MKRHPVPYRLAIASAILLVSCGRFWADEPKPALNAALQKEMAQMVADDQKARFAVIEIMKNTDAKDAEAAKKNADSPEVRKVVELDEKHTKRMKEIIEQYGWPGKSLVGMKGSHDAWLLVQHADREPVFQRRCLELMADAIKKDEADKKDFAYLTDRVLCAEKKKQLYGTQLETVNGELVPKPIEDEGNVDQRRKEIGLQPLAEYVKFARATYQKKDK